MYAMAVGDEDIDVLSVATSVPLDFAVLGGELVFHTLERCVAETRFGDGETPAGDDILNVGPRVVHEEGCLTTEHAKNE